MAATKTFTTIVTESKRDTIFFVLGENFSANKPPQRWKIIYLHSHFNPLKCFAALTRSRAQVESPRNIVDLCGRTTSNS